MEKDLKMIRKLFLFFIAALFLSVVAAIPIGDDPPLLPEIFSFGSPLHFWAQKVLPAYQNVKYGTHLLIPAYGWVALARFILALLFVGPWEDPLKNIWVIESGSVACVLTYPPAFIEGYYRGIAPALRLIDCAFGVFGFIPLLHLLFTSKAIRSKKLFN